MADREKVEPGIWRRHDRAGKPVYEITYRDSDGRQRRQTVEGGQKAARTALADVRARMGKGQRVAPQPKLTFGQAAERWQDAQKARLRPTTVKTYDSQLRTHLLSRWERRRLDSLTVDDVARLTEEMRAAGLKAWTIRGSLVTASRVFDFARRRLGWAGENPVRALDRSERPRSDQRERRVLSQAELDAVLGALRGPYRLAAMIAAMTGCRVGEVLGLRWRSLDLQTATGRIDGQLDRQGQLGPPKTERSKRTIELPDVLVRELRAHKLASPACGPDDYVLVSRTGNPLEHRTTARAFADAVERAGISSPAPSFHSLRHTFASRFIASGGDLVTLSSHLGHGSPAITASTYSHEWERASRGEERRARLEAMFGSAVAATDRSTPQSSTGPVAGEVRDLQAMRDSA